MHLKRVKNVVVCAVLCCAGFVSAQDQEKLTRDQWKGRVGESAKDKAVLEETLKKMDPKDRVEFTQRMLKAVTRMPLGPVAKAARYTESSLLCVAGTQGDMDLHLDVIAETLALSPVAYLPSLVKELSERLDPKKNNVSVEKYREFAEKGVQKCIKRHEQADDPKVRNTFAILLFLQAADIPGLQDALLALLPDDNSRSLAAAWLADAMKGDYAALLAAADVPVTPPPPAINMSGHPQTARLLTYLAIMDSSFDALVVSGTGSSMSTVDVQIDSNIQQTPIPQIVGYQNQGTSLRKPCWCVERVVDGRITFN